MSHRYDTSLISGAYVYGVGSLGVLAENIPSTGDAGPSFLFNDLSLPADNGKEICGRITTWPTNGTLVADENGAFIYTPFSDGADSFAYQLKVDGVDVGVPVTVGLQAGSPIASFAQTTDDAVAAFASRVHPLAAFIQTTSDTTASFAGQVLPLASFNQVTDDAISAFAAKVTPLSAFSITTANTAFAGSAGTVTSGSFTGQTADTVVSGGATSKPIATFSTILSDSIFTGGASIVGSSNYHIQLEDAIFVGSASVKPICAFSQTSEDLVLNGGFSVDNSTTATFSITLEDAECSFNAQSRPVAYFNIQLDNALFNFGSLYNKSPIYLKYVLPEQQTLKLIVN